VAVADAQDRSRPFVRAALEGDVVLRVIVARLDLSREELDAARKLVETGFPRQAISRASHAAFYAAWRSWKRAAKRAEDSQVGMHD
jgi:hypothetical protein